MFFLQRDVWKGLIEKVILQVLVMDIDDLLDVGR